MIAAELKALAERMLRYGTDSNVGPEVFSPSNVQAIARAYLRLVKAGDAFVRELDGRSSLNRVRELISDWNAAKEGR